MKEKETEKMEKAEPEFSLDQSNILYLLFITGATICLGLDITVQINRRDIWNINPITEGFVLVLLANLLLWLDFAWTIVRQRDEGDDTRPGGFLSDVVSYSTNSLCCVLLVPLSVMRKAPG